MLAIVLPAALLLIPPAMVLARAGGGEGFDGGGGGGGGSGGGGGYAIYLLIRLCIDYPAIGVPVVVVVAIVLVAGSRHGTNIYQSSVMRRGSEVIDEQSKNSVIAAIRQHDPQFDEGAFCKRVADAFAKVQQA